MTAYRLGAGAGAGPFVLARRKPLRAFPGVFGGLAIVVGFAAAVVIGELASPTGASIGLPIGIGSIAATLLLAVVVRSLRRVSFVATNDAMTVRVPARWGLTTRELVVPWVSITRVGHAYGSRGPAIVLRFGGREVHLPMGAFTARPEVIASRVRRFRAFAGAGLRPKQEEIDAHAARFAERRVLPEGSWSSPTRWLSLSKEGIHVGSSFSVDVLVPWSDVCAAHVVEWVSGLPDVLQVELVDGRVLDVEPRSGLGREELAALLAPRFVPLGGRERSMLDPPEPDDRKYYEAPLDVAEPAPRASKKKRRRAVAASDGLE